MTNELKPCLLCEGEAKLFRRSGTVGRVCPSKWYRERVECKVCGLTTREYKSPGAATRSWNTRPTPVAPVSPDATGKCGEWVRYSPEAWSAEPRHYSYVVPDANGEYVRFDQAEELLAAERAENAELKRDRRFKQHVIDGLVVDKENLKADNAAKDARIKELDRCHEGTIDLCNQKTAEIKTLEAKLAKLGEQKPVGSYEIENGHVMSTTDYFPDGLPYPDGDLELYVHPVDSAAEIARLRDLLRQARKSLKRAPFNLFKEIDAILEDKP